MLDAPTIGGGWKMKTNLYMIQDDLEDLNLRGHVVDDPWVARCSHPVLCSKMVREFHDDAIYICNPGQLPKHVPSTIGTPSIICIGKPSDEWLMAACNLLYTEGDEDATDLFNQVAASIARYQAWEDRILDILDGDESEDDLVACVRQYIKNPFFVQGSEFRVLISSMPDDSASTPKLESYMREYGALRKSDVLSPEDISLCLSDDEYYASKDTVEPYIYPGQYLSCRSLCCNIWSSGVRLGRIVVDEVVEPIANRDFMLAKVLGQHLSKTIERSQGPGSVGTEDLEPILQSLLSHKLLPEERIAHLLDSLGWNMDDGYACLVLRLKTRGDNVYAFKPLAMGVAQFLSLECYTVYESSIVYVCNLSKMGIDGEEMLSNVLPYLRDNLLMASLSSTYGDFKDLYYYYKQAEFAFDAGLRREPSKWTFRFEDYKMDYILSKVMDKNVAGVLVPEGLRALVEHDESKGTDYVEMLRVYLDNDRNIAATIRIMHVHRNTFLYRIQKIEEILGMDLDDPDVRVTLRIALRVMEAEAESPVSAKNI